MAAIWTGGFPPARSAPHDAPTAGRGREQARPVRDVLLRCASDRSDPATLAIAGVLASAFERDGETLLPLPGLRADDTRRLMSHWFPGADRALGLDWRRLDHARRSEPRADEIEDVAALLVESAARHRGADPVRWLAHAMACACLGGNHLWQDLQLPSRQELSTLLQDWFPALAARNTRNMKWKKFFYKQLCERADLRICKSPSCEVCSDHAVCFGPEEAA